MLEIQRSGGQRPSAPFHPAISITDDGLVCGAGSILVRMASGGGKPRLRVEDDAGRLVAMLSAALNRRVSAVEIVPHFTAAGEHWSRGDKAVANFRLTFARLPQLRDAADSDQLLRAEYVLDHGLSPDALMQALGFGPLASCLRKYREDEPRVPAGLGVQSGRWTKDPRFAPPRNTSIRIAEELPPEDEKDYETRRLEGEASRQEDIEHGRSGLLDTPGLPRGIGPGPFAAEPIPAGPGPKPDPAQQQLINKNVCSECGTSVSGTKSGNMIGDHQNPTALIQPGEQQSFYTHCLACSRRQGGLVRAFKYRKNPR